MSEAAAIAILCAAKSLHEREGIHFADTSVSVSYPEHGNTLSHELEKDSFWFRHRNDCIVSALEQFPPDPALVFDVGGGNGYVAKGMQEAGVTVVLVEPIPAGARNAKDSGLRYVVCAAMSEAGFPPESIPAIGLFDVLEHIEDDVLFLKSMSSHLAPGGRIYLTVPAYRWLWSAYDNEAGHFRRYTLGGLKKAFERGGFEVEYSTYFFHFLPIPLFFGRTLPSRMGAFRGGIPHEHAKSEHSGSGGLVRKLVDLICDLEAWWIGKGFPVPFGGSCLVVARKQNP